jgi:hypothetical protein
VQLISAFTRLPTPVEVMVFMPPLRAQLLPRLQVFDCDVAEEDEQQE